MSEHHTPMPGWLPDEAIAADGCTRRDFVRRLSAAIALAGAEACTRLPDEEILPYVEQPPELTPGRARWFATASVLDGLGTGLLVESRDGRPIKVEGNPDHPASLGAAGILEQATVWQLYDPDRARHALHRGRRSGWRDMAAALHDAVRPNEIGATGAGLCLLLQPTSSATDAALLDRIRERFPAAGIHFHAPLVPPRLWHREPFSALEALPDFSRARVIFALDSDFLSAGPFQLRFAHDYANGRAAAGFEHRLYVAESALSVTGAAADHRFRVDPRDTVALLAAMWQVLENNVADTSAPAWIPLVMQDLARRRGESLVVVGPHVSSEARVYAAAINDALGNTNRTVRYVTSPLYGAGDPSHSLSALLTLLESGATTTLVSIGGNPCYTLAGDAGYAERLGRIRSTFHAGLYPNETAAASEWFAPLAHDLERWGDVRAYDGTACVIQPLVRPLHESVPQTEVLMTLAGRAAGSAYESVRSQWRQHFAAGDFEAAWSETLQRGVLDGTASAQLARAPVVRPADDSPRRFAAPESLGVLPVRLVPDAAVHDGSFANVPWLQEFPRPITSLTWAAAAHLSPHTAAQLGVRDGSTLRLARAGRTIDMPALLVPGQADGCLVLPLGYGRTGAERVAAGLGTNALELAPRSGELLCDAVHVTIPADTALVPLARAQAYRGTSRNRLPVVTPNETRAPAAPPAASLYKPGDTPPLSAPQQWAMTIDLDRCTGCGACVIACQAENNVPVVGADDVRRGRAMHWLRIDTYSSGPDENPETLVQPMLCQHCEKAPCEYVCPVEATTHSSDGLNEMVYNRCVGTRFCSNNCPYKVRRFNWFDYTSDAPALVQLARNPDVTVRQRGVMEKCTFCVQRIREAEITASVEQRELRGTEVRTACQQACPTNAIVFGSLTDPDSIAMLARDDPRSFDSLAELGTRPRVRYLARRRNANPALDGIA